MRWGGSVPILIEMCTENLFCVFGPVYAEPEIYNVMSTIAQSLLLTVILRRLQTTLLSMSCFFFFSFQ